MVGVHRSWTVGESGFLFLQCLVVGSPCCGRLRLVLGAVFPSEDEKTGKHPLCVFFSVPESFCKLAETNPDGLGRHRDGLRTRACASVTCSLLHFSYSDSHLDALAGTQTFSKQIHTAVGLDTAPEPVCPVKLLQALVRASSASFQPLAWLCLGQHHPWAESSPCTTTADGDWVSERAELCPLWALCPVVSPWTRAGTISVGATGSCQAGLAQPHHGLLCLGKKIDEFWNMFISCSLHLVVVSINMPLTHAH